jgi:hypothetical protein
MKIKIQILKRTKCLLFGVLLTCFVACAGWRVEAATYYVATNGNDISGNGSAGNPWATISHADASSLAPGDVVIVQAGTYAQTSANGAMLQASAGTQASPITYLANGNVIIDQSAFPGANYGIQVLVSGITLSGFEVRHAAHGIYFYNVGYGLVTNCVVHDSQPQVDSSGVYFNAAWNSTVEKSVMYNINSGVDAPWSPVGAGVREVVATNIFVLNNTIVNCWLGMFVMDQAPPWAPLTTLNNIVVNSAGWAFVNPWSVDPSWCTNGYNLLYNDTVTYGNYPAGNNGPVASDVTGNPQFVFAATADFHLLAGSPALDKGTNVGLPFQGTAPDIGAFEGAYSPSTNGTVSGTVTANIPGSPAVPNAVVQTPGGTASTVSDVNGNYSLILPAGTVTLQVSSRGLASSTNTTNLPNGGKVVLNFSLSQTYVPVTYYVNNGTGNDSNPGTSGSPWKTIGNGDRLGVLNPGDMVIVQAGTYAQVSTNGVTLTNNYGYSFSPVTYKAQGNVVINQSSYTGTSYGFKVAVAGITLTGFEIKGAQHGIYLSPASSSCTVSNCLIHDANAVGQDAEGIFVDNSPNNTLTRNVIYNITDPGDLPWAPIGCGIRVSNGNNLDVENNTIDNAFIGIFWYGSRLDLSGVDHGPWGTMTALNNIVVNCSSDAFASPQSQDPSLITAGYNLVFGNGFDYQNVPGGNLSPLPSDVKERDPKFVNAAANNYQLTSDSPAIDAGTYVGFPYSGLGPDIGAFESGFSNTPHTYYVNGATGNDSNQGTAAQPWKTIGNGDASGVLKPGDVVMVSAGNYAQASADGVKLANNSGTPIAPITYQAQGSVVIDQSTFGVGSYGFQVQLAGIVLNGFEIMGAQYGVYLAPGSGSCTVDSCVIHDASYAGVPRAGIYAVQSINDTLQRNVIYNIINASDAPWDANGSGIRDSDSDNLKVLNNTIDNCYLGLFFYGVILGGGPYGSITTYNNIVVNCTGWSFVNPWNTTPQIFTHGYNLTFNDANNYGNYPGGNQGPLAHDIDGSDPLFVNESTHNYHLQNGSAAINTGKDVGLPYSGAAPDIGAYDTINTTVPTVLFAQRDNAQPTVVTVVFSTLLKPSTATNLSNYSLNNGNIISAANLNGDGVTVVLTTSPLANNTTNNILTINNVQNDEGINIAANTQVLILVPNDTIRAQYSLGSTNVVALEAEHYNANVPSTDGTHRWIFTTSPPLLSPTDVNTNYSGEGVMLAIPNSGVNTGTPAFGAGAPAASCRMDFKVQFYSTGTYYVWVRGLGDSAPGPSQNDSVLVGFDGGLAAGITGFPLGQGYIWANTAAGNNGPIVVSTPGVHTINVWMREDGFAIDKLLLSSDSAFNPTGIGPAESAAVPSLAIANLGGKLVLTWGGSGILQSSTNVSGIYSDIIGSSSPWTNTPAGAQMYFRVKQ